MSEPQVVVWLINDVRRWSSGREGLKWWSGGATTSDDGPVVVWRSNDVRRWSGGGEGLKWWSS
ncbi:hypothetical protein MA16_Dca003589 [Dendrobium catenatum]|uniref:Uncharacterized protein n=1 Tax=Dendrobium catenatum TaxID=906689 RepID=A0A2I0WFE7_9ASPA|nr:hypothetical protein MA16_Dca003589 [Dendrobium catenatum]